MLRQLIASLGMLGSLGAVTAAAQSIEDFELNSTADLVDVCAPADGGTSADVALAFCYGYIVGGSDLYAGLVQADAIKPWACAEPVPQLTEIRNAFVKWAQNHPESRSAHPADSFWQAMSEAYPCK